jgi:hypothetical protein
MTIDCTTPGQVEIRMIDHITEILEALEKTEQPNGRGTKTSAAPADLFKIDNDCETLNKKTSNSVPQPGGKDFACHQASQAKHLHHSRLPHNKSEGAR